MTHSILLSAARNDSLQSYLKAIAILRLLSNQRGIPIRGAWQDGAFRLHGISRIALEEFFLDSYQPTPILNPWNSGAGFDSKSRLKTAGKTLDRVAAEAARWPQYASALAIAREVIKESGNRMNDADEVKRNILLRLRARYSDVALEWLDAAVLIGGTKLAFPTILGTGGNDGHLDFSINFAQRALDVIGSKPLASRHVLLRDALDGTAEASLIEGVFGQYRLGAGNFINPWDFIFTIEGAIAFAGSVSRRFSSTSDRPTVPFQFDAVAAGYAAASDKEVTRGELWLPVWRGLATYRAVRSMLRGGRVELISDRRGAVESVSHVASGAADSIAAVAAAQTFGVATGIESFGRIVFAERNGRSFGASYVGRIAVADRPEIAALSRETVTWIQRAARLKLGAAGRAALRAYNEGMVDYAARPLAATFQNMLAALAEIDDDVAISRDERRPLPLPFLPSDIFDAIDSMVATSREQFEHRIARALTSIGFRHRRHRLRYKIGRIAFGERADQYGTQRRFVWKPDVRDTLSEIFVREVREAGAAPSSDDEGFAARLRGSSGIVIDDLAHLLAGSVDWRRVKTLLRAYSIVAPRIPKRQTFQAIKPLTHNSAATDLAESTHLTAIAVPASFAALRVLANGYRPHEASVESGYTNITYLDTETVYQLAATKTGRAFGGAYARLRSAGADVRDFRFASIEPNELSTFIASLLVPIRLRTANALQRRIMLERQPITVQAKTS